ncbi:MAG: PAS domain-containing sensor histidine kinase [Calothrix sp. C42_A2020_038]|nr:PAS domain-containing sensor histidine kinase [Calothrix sp. C42_A2020_038]
MKISTKFITSSIVVAVLVAIGLGGGQLLINSATYKLKQKNTVLYQGIEKAYQLRELIQTEVINLKDIVLLDSTDSRLKLSRQQILIILKELEEVLTDSAELQEINSRYLFLEKLTNNLVTPTKNKPETFIEDSQQDFRAINSFSRDISFLLDIIMVKLTQQKELISQQQQQLQHLDQLTTYGTISLILIASAVQFWLILLPTIRNIKKLQIGVFTIGAGDLDYRLNMKTNDEIEQLSNEFDKMASKLSQSYAAILNRETALSNANNTLLQEVAERQQAETQLRQQTRQLEETLQELQRTHSQLVQQEKMSSLGQLVAGVAHEINNPVNFIHGNLAYVEQYTQNLLDFIQYQQNFPDDVAGIQAQAEELELEFLQEDLSKILRSMKIGTQRIREIVLSLRNFSRMDEAEFKAVDIHEGIDSTLLILQHRLKATTQRPEIQVVKDYSVLPLVECYAGQLNQVFMNILANAIDALEEADIKRLSENIKSEPHQISISTSVIDTKWVEITITDNGLGMPDNIRKRIFDPFFTTKPVGKGTGMGMSISYQIITDKHNGNIECFSTSGVGTKFIIQIPIQQSVNL